MLLNGNPQPPNDLFLLFSNRSFVSTCRPWSMSHHLPQEPLATNLHPETIQNDLQIIYMKSKKVYAVP